MRKPKLLAMVKVPLLWLLLLVLVLVLDLLPMQATLQGQLGKALHTEVMPPQGVLPPIPVQMLRLQLVVCHRRAMMLSKMLVGDYGVGKMAKVVSTLLRLLQTPRWQ
jgi:hypothetical protein